MPGNTSKATPESSPLHGLLNNTVEGGKASYYNDISQEVTLPHSMGKGQGWGFPRRPNTGSGAFFSMRWVGFEGLGIATPEASPSRPSAWRPNPPPSGLWPGARILPLPAFGLPPPPPSGGGKSVVLQRYKPRSHPSPFDGEGPGMGIPPSPQHREWSFLFHEVGGI